MREGYTLLRESENHGGWTCRVCETTYEDEDDAQECCEDFVYACPVCEEKHNNEESAKDCCDKARQGSGRVVLLYQCNWCHRKHLAKEPAEKCCPLRNYKCSSCGEKFTIEQVENKEICSCDRSVHQVILF